MPSPTSQKSSDTIVRLYRSGGARIVAMAVTRPSSESTGPLRELGEEEIRRLSIDTIRGLAMDAVQKANAGHPGTAMALAPLGYTIFRKLLRANPADPHCAHPAR